MRFFLCAILLLNTTTAHADYCERVVDAIYKAEGGKSAKVHYGILSVKTKNPNKTCLEVVRWHYLKWSGSDARYKTDFIPYLRDKYAPLGAKNDPRHLNQNWAKNVTYFMEAK